MKTRSNLFGPFDETTSEMLADQLGKEIRRGSQGFSVEILAGDDTFHLDYDKEHDTIYVFYVRDNQKRRMIYSQDRSTDKASIDLQWRGLHDRCGLWTLFEKLGQLCY